MKAALCHDWLNGMRGGEKCLEKIGEIFPDAPIYTLFCDRTKISDTIKKHKIYTSFIQGWPFRERVYRNYLPFFPKAVESFDLEAFDLIVSTSHCVAKGARKSKKAVHVCYCFTPMRYAWLFFDDYFGSENGFKKFAIQKILKRLQKWDKDSSQRVDHFIAISGHIQKRIKNCYAREAAVIYPPVDTDFYTPDGTERGEAYLIVSAFVPYKKIEVAIEAFNEMKKPLIIIGGGPCEAALKKIAGPTVSFLGWRENEVIRNYYRNARALIFPGEEDFGIVPVEMQACGGAVIAYAAGGALETVRENSTGIFFYQPTKEALKQAILDFEKKSFSEKDARRNAERFSAARFMNEMRVFTEKVMKKEAAVLV